MEQHYVACDNNDYYYTVEIVIKNTNSMYADRYIHTVKVPKTGKLSLIANYFENKYNITNFVRFEVSPTEGYILLDTAPDGEVYIKRSNKFMVPLEKIKEVIIL
jgi:hypothetical protein